MLGAVVVDVGVGVAPIFASKVDSVWFVVDDVELVDVMFAYFPTLSVLSMSDLAVAMTSILF